MYKRQIGYAAPEQIDDYLRQGMKSFLGGDYATARAIYQTLLPPIAEADIDLGQHELVDEVLTRPRARLRCPVFGDGLRGHAGRSSSGGAVAGHWRGRRQQHVLGAARGNGACRARTAT